ncbi:helix-turn-helix domain-containing protein [Paenibacillus aceris]|uniref:Transcriptional regulator with XRE-family HTH domain n=1 Tax=Paenibacillus aceris TaxID=869555 RepID=A0ABS4I387_9BACL|nr:helix-turn-helix domain-containing protein [Paenibacillus aceris]MBP1965265.1 transcriptional regulator with XRE-family HTH domain [Paenibacillus aceris]NHW35948.1 helix-turn-helix domain-containing protein [Paenibacillus aceris]
MYFYDKLRDLRKLKGFTLRELADRSGVSAAYISQLENGNRGIPSPEVLMKLSEGLNTSYSELMDLAGYLESTPSMEKFQSNPVNLRRFLRENELMFDGHLLTDEDKEWVERMLTVLFWKQRQEAKQHDREATQG